MFMSVTAFDNYLFLWPVHRVGSVYSNPVCLKVFSVHFHGGLLPTFIGGAVYNCSCVLFDPVSRITFLAFLVFSDAVL